MKEEYKYYTPTIEEFHVGFEYEAFEDKKWITEIILNSSDLDAFLFKYINFDTKFRVKYIDKADIEELGWEEIENCELQIFALPSSINDTKFNYFLSLFKVGSVPYLEIDKAGVFIKNIIFSGTIKNKSELEVLMKQLGMV